MTLPDAPQVALVGDYSPDVPAHRAIPRAIEIAGAAIGRNVLARWYPTDQIVEAGTDLADCAAVWVVPASPYANMGGALDAIRWARETRRPFLGTCGGFQHALVEFARNVAGLAGADHAESNERAEILVVTPLSCPLVEKSGPLRFVPESQLHRVYGHEHSSEDYHCRYGLNQEHGARLEKAGLRFSGFDGDGGPRAFELPSHPFFIGTLFQPERSAFRGAAHPLICAFLQAICLPARGTNDGDLTKIQ